MSVGKATPDLDSDETQIGKISVEGRLGGDEPYYASSNVNISEIDEPEFSDEDIESRNVNLPRSVNLSRRRRAKNKKLFMILLPRKLCSSLIWSLQM